jgi:quercetin dioxygenase-like cupin family protein
MSAVERFPDFIGRLPALDLPFPGVTGRVIQDAGHQVVFLDFPETIEVPEHTHEDQWEFALAGKVELRREGRTEVYGPGGQFFIPAGTPHAATVHAGYKALIVFAAPDRYPLKAR